MITILVVTGAVPRFPQAPKSYLVLPKIEDAYTRFNFEISFKPERPNGLILYNGQRRGSNVKYLSLSLNEGYPEFRFDFGNEPTIVKAQSPITLGQWHTVKVKRLRKEGSLSVDNQTTVPFPSIRLQLLDLNDQLYLGNVPRYEDIPASATEYKEGFVGCISRLLIRDQEIDLIEKATYVEGTTSCETCADEPCLNDGVCLESQSPSGHQCICMEGFKGKTCNIRGYGCLADTCGTGRCLELETGIQCLCPINKTGDRCQYIEHLDEENLAFRDGSYAAYRTPKLRKMEIKFKVRPENLNDSVILYMSESNAAVTGDLVSVVLKNKYIELRFRTGSEPAIVVRSQYPIEANKWTDIEISRRHSECRLQVGNQPLVTGRTHSVAREFYIKSLLYLGGYNKEHQLNNGLQDISRGFDGCIAGVSFINHFFLVLNYRALTQFNIF